MMDEITEIEIDALGWGVYEQSCFLCGKQVVVVATVHSVEHGYAEWFQRGNRLCQSCKNCVANWN